MLLSEAEGKDSIKFTIRGGEYEGLWTHLAEDNRSALLDDSGGEMLENFNGGDDIVFADDSWVEVDEGTCQTNISLKSTRQIFMKDKDMPRSKEVRISRHLVGSGCPLFHSAKQFSRPLVRSLLSMSIPVIISSSSSSVQPKRLLINVPSDPQPTSRTERTEKVSETSSIPLRTSTWRWIQRSGSNLTHGCGTVRASTGAEESELAFDVIFCVKKVSNKMKHNLLDGCQQTRCCR